MERPHPMLVVVTVAGIFLVVLWLAQRTLIYFPESELPPPSAVGVPQAEPVSFRTEDGLDLDAWFVAAREPSANRTIVVFNGNAGNRAHRAMMAAVFAEHGFSTLLVDYRGYGGNPGLPSERGLERDARAALRYLVSRADVDRRRIVYFGESLGAAVALRLAIEEPPAALILRSPFTSLGAIGGRHYPYLPVRWFLKDRYPSIDRIGQIACPVLFIAGDEDRIVPLDDTELLFEAARQPKRLVVIEGSGHNDAEIAIGSQVMKAITDFLR